MKPLQTICITLLAIMIAGSAMAQTSPRVPKKMDYSKHWMMKRRGLMRQIDLTKDQQKQIKKIRLNLSEAMIPLRNQLREKKARLRTLTTGEDADFNAAEKIVDDMAGLRAEMMKKGLQSRKQIRDLLTDEQKVKFDARPGFRKHGFAHRMQGHHRR